MHPLRNLGTFASLPLVQGRISSILATPATISTMVFMASLFLCFVPPYFSYFLLSGQQGTDWLAWDLTRCPASERGACLPLLPGPFSTRRSSLGFKKERVLLLSAGRETFYNERFTHGVVPTASGNNPFLFSPSWDTVVGSGSRACSPQSPGEGVCSHCWGFSVGYQNQSLVANHKGIGKRPS